MLLSRLFLLMLVRLSGKCGRNMALNLSETKNRDQKFLIAVFIKFVLLDDLKSYASRIVLISYGRMEN